MRMLSRTTAAVGAAGLVAAGLASAAPANATSANSARSDDIFQIKVNEIQTSYDDDFTGMPDVGDSFEWTANLRQDGKRVGKDAGTCEFKRFIGDDDDPDEAVLRCVVRYHFFNTGKIRAAGKVRVDWDDLKDSDFVATLPVRSGTGKFDDAGGTVRNRQINEDKAKLRFRLTNVV
jgi:hypothetical protein